MMLFFYINNEQLINVGFCFRHFIKRKFMCLQEYLFKLRKDRGQSPTQTKLYFCFDSICEEIVWQLLISNCQLPEYWHLKENKFHTRFN